MSIKASNWAWDQHLPPSSKIVLMALADAADDLGVCWPRISIIARKCCTSERTVQRVLKELEAKKFVTVSKQFRSDGGQSSNRYTLEIFTPLTKCDPPPARKTPATDQSVSPPVPHMSPGDDKMLSPHKPTENPNKESLQQLPKGNLHGDSDPVNYSEHGETTESQLIWPHMLTSRSEKKVIMEMMESFEHTTAQMLLDELQGALATHSIKTSPSRWVRGIISKFRKGTFVANAGLAVAEKRNRRRLDINTPKPNDQLDQPTSTISDAEKRARWQHIKHGVTSGSKISF
ncbi:helix-turn-helix domain-containing protein [Pseudomonas sp. Mn2068]|uniref:helix-turn-helix domain-containing protein n=1 Tax=Pseudomonas sp. Mn2068 TaxID=3395265 RepID=UPI003BCA7045